MCLLYYTNINTKTIVTRVHRCYKDIIAFSRDRRPSVYYVRYDNEDVRPRYRMSGQRCAASSRWSGRQIASMERGECGGDRAVNDENP